MNRIPSAAGVDLTCADWLLDGQQRWTAIVDYVAGEFPVLGRYFPELSLVARRDFRGRQIGEMVTHLTDPADCLRVYNRLCYGGTPHEAVAEDAPLPGIRR